MTRGVLFMVWGENARVNSALLRAQDSAKRWGLDYHVARQSMYSDLRVKSQMFDLSPFDTTLYLDADTVVLGNLDFAFQQAERYGIACAINPCPWARRYVGLSDRRDLVEYDTGVVAFSRKAKPLFDAWKSGFEMDSATFFYAKDGLARMPVNDQCAFAHAVDSTGINPFVLPVNWNYHPKWNKCVFGDIRIWHDYNDPPPNVATWNKSQCDNTIIECGTVSA